jgi:hypothetical protein
MPGRSLAAACTSYRSSFDSARESRCRLAGRHISGRHYAHRQIYTHLQDGFGGCEALKYGCINLTAGLLLAG